MTEHKNSQAGLATRIGLGLALGVVLGITLENLALLLGTGLVIGLAFGMLYDQQQAKKRPQVKVVDGATYTTVNREHPPGQRSQYWLGDNGTGLELTDDEANQYGLE